MDKTAYYMRNSHYLQNIVTQVDKMEERWKAYQDEGISGSIYFANYFRRMKKTKNHLRVQSQV